MRTSPSVSIREIVTLNGNVDWYYQRDAAENDAAMISGVISVNDQIRVTQPQTSVTDISSGIARAFARNAELYDDNVNVDVNGSRVTLSGTVETWSERDMAEDIAWMAPGVTDVDDNIFVLAS